MLEFGRRNPLDALFSGGLHGHQRFLVWLAYALALFAGVMQADADRLCTGGILNHGLDYRGPSAHNRREHGTDPATDTHRHVLLRQPSRGNRIPLPAGRRVSKSPTAKAVHAASEPAAPTMMPPWPRSSPAPALRRRGPLTARSLTTPKAERGPSIDATTMHIALAAHVWAERSGGT
jgi:hypothetical protein